MKHPLTLIPITILLTSACSEAALPPSDIHVEHISARVSPGGVVHIDTAALAPDTLTITLVQPGRSPQFLAPHLTLSIAKGTVYSLPRDLDTGTAEIHIRERERLTEPRIERVEVVAPWLQSLDHEIGLDAPHAGYYDRDDTAEGGGVAVADIDGDGDEDLFLALGANPARLFLNDTPAGAEMPNLSEHTTLLGDIRDASSAVFIDVDNDGDQDLFVGRMGADLLFINTLSETGELRFEERAQSLGLAQHLGNTVGSAWGDVDNDGDLDVYIQHNGELTEDGYTDQLLRNDGDHFTDVSHTMTLRDRQLTSFAAVWIDDDRDGDVDLLVASDHLADVPLSRPNARWRNDGAWTFEEVGEACGFGMFPDGKLRTMNAMGLATGDVDGDGAPDVLVSNIGPNALMRGTGDGHFEDIADDVGAERRWVPWLQTGTPMFDWSITWGTHLLDIDNDGDEDAFLVGGAQPQLFGNRNVPHALLVQETPLSFADRSLEAGVLDPGQGQGSAEIDLNRDGWMDLVVINRDAPATAFLNRRGDTLEHRALSLALDGHTSNRDAIGAIVELSVDGLPLQTCFVTTRPSFGSGGSRRCHFGLGQSHAETVLATVRWPSGIISEHPVALSDVATFETLTEPRID